YRDGLETVVRFVSDETRFLAIEGPVAWIRSGDQVSLASAVDRRFVTGHQFHALAFHFNDIIANAQAVKAVVLDDAAYDGQRGDFPDGGTATLLEDETGKAIGLILALPDTTEITVSYGDWRRMADGVLVPFSTKVTHEGVVYDYQYTDVSFAAGDAVSFHEAYPAPAIDAVQVHRLHRSLLAAHCRGDAQMMAQLTAPEALIANRGEVAVTSPDDMKTRFASVFSRVDYRAYLDLEQPAIEVAESGDIGWAVVKVRAEGEVIETGDAFSDQWAWALLAKKVDGVWLHAGNASNLKPE
ncbi:MAG: nuclear transport factor 2 family protein, partial [Pseudomonadota bacterium]